MIGRRAEPGVVVPGSAGPHTGARALALALLLILGGCARGSGDEPTPPPPAPDLAGARVMLFPARVPAPERLDAELAYWLGDRAPATDWLLPAALQRAADGVPTWRLRLEALRRPVAEVERGDYRVRDPLYGVLRQLGAVVHADYALVPLMVSEQEDSTGVALAVDLALVHIRGGRILWRHTARGERNTERAAAVASVAETVARSLVPR